MPSFSHQWLVLWAARKMISDGYVITRIDGPVPQGGQFNSLPSNISHLGVKPDVWGVHRATGQFAIGEAKTAGDVANSHTRSQLRVFSRLNSGEAVGVCQLYLAVPQSAGSKLESMLAAEGLQHATNIVRLLIPDCLLEDVYDVG